MLVWSEILLIVIAVVALLGLWAWWYANRLDRLHRKVLASRMALDAQLVRRAAAAAQYASAGYFDPATSLLIISAAHDVAVSRAAGDHLLFEAIPELAAAGSQEHSTHSAPSTPALTANTQPSRAAVVQHLNSGEFDDERIAAENELTQALREALSESDEVAHLYADEGSAMVLDELATAWYRAQLARRFHNESVAQVQQLRRNTLIRVFRIAGHAPMPHTVDLDDAWPPLLRTPNGAVTA